VKPTHPVLCKTFIVLEKFKKKILFKDALNYKTPPLNPYKQIFLPVSKEIEVNYVGFADY